MYTINGYYGIEEIKNIFDLPCYDRCKSFYGKAQIIETDKGRYLKSYNTLICFLSYGGTFIKLWDGYSQTTQRHINSFIEFTRIPIVKGKKAYSELPNNFKLWEA